MHDDPQGAAGHILRMLPDALLCPPAVGVLSLLRLRLSSSSSLTPYGGPRGYS